MADPTTTDLVQQLNRVQLKVTESLGDLNATVKAMSVQIANMSERLHKQNGHVTELFTRMKDVELHPTNCIMRDKFAEMKQTLETGKHPGSYELRARVEAVEVDSKQHLTSVEKKEKCQGVWKEKFWIPLIKTAATMFAAMMLLLLAMHIQELINK